MKRSTLMIFVGPLMVFLLPGWVFAQGETRRQAGLGRLMMQCQERFGEMDLNKDGKVTKDEFMAQHHLGGRAEEIFTSRDSNGDGLLIQEEFCSGKSRGKGNGRANNRSKTFNM